MALLPVLVVLLIDYFRTFPERITCNTLPLSPGSKATHLTNNTTRGSRWRDIHFAKSNLKPMDEHGGGIIHRGAAQLQISSIGRPLAHSKSMKAILCPPLSQMILCIRVSKLVAVDVSKLHVCLFHSISALLSSDTVRVCANSHGRTTNASNSASE